MRFDQVGTQLPQRPAPIRLSDLAWRLIRQLHDTGFLAGRDPRRRASRLQLRNGPDPGRRKRLQIRIDRIDMHTLRGCDLQGAQPHAVEQQGLRPALLVAIHQAGHQLAQPANFARARATDVQWTGHGLAS
jgi:hypothetical protein